MADRNVVVQFAAAPEPLVLTLPQVPDGAVALEVPDDADGKIRFIPAARDEYDKAWRQEDTGILYGFGDILTTHVSVTVVMREPRTWPRLEDAPEDLKVVRGATGMIYRLSGLGWEADDDSATCDSLPSLQNYDGPLAEVLDA